jgi:hypothetical protein
MTQQLAQPEPTAASAPSAYAGYVNPEWVRLLDLLGMNVRYRRCAGAEVYGGRHLLRGQRVTLLRRLLVRRP